MFIIKETGGTIPIGLLLDYNDGRSPVQPILDEYKVYLDCADGTVKEYTSGMSDYIGSSPGNKFNLTPQSGTLPIGSAFLSIVNGVLGNTLVPKSIPIMVVSEAAYEQMFGGVDAVIHQEG
jgi:hypothetical protein